MLSIPIKPHKFSFLLVQELNYGNKQLFLLLTTYIENITISVNLDTRLWNRSQPSHAYSRTHPQLTIHVNHKTSHGFPVRQLTSEWQTSLSGGHRAVGSQILAFPGVQNPDRKRFHKVYMTKRSSMSCFPQLANGRKCCKVSCDDQCGLTLVPLKGTGGIET